MFNQSQPSVMSHSFSQAPSIDDMPRSSFDRSHGYKTTFNAGYLVPVFVDEVLPGDTFNLNSTLFARINTPIYPIMDNLFLDTHFFFVPYRQIWSNFRKFCGEQVDPGDSTDYTIPTIESTAITGYSNQSLYDYFGLPTLVDGYEHSVLPLRAYNHIYNEWFRDQNLIDTVPITLGDSGDDPATFVLRKRGKRHDYFTSCLPWLQKGDSPTIPISGTPYVRSAAPHGERISLWGGDSSVWSTMALDAGPRVVMDSVFTGDVDNRMFVNLAGSTSITINDLRLAVQIQKLLERDARSGTRYAEIVQAHFGVKFIDVTYRPEYLGGSSAPVRFQPVPDHSDVNRSLGSLAATGAVVGSGGFTKSFTEHGIIIGIASVRADLTYQQGLDRFWFRQSRYDFYWPALAHLGEQAVLNKEIYTQGTGADELVFGYQERWAEYRYKQSHITGKMRSNDPTPLDAWHLSQEFGSLPALNQTFIEETPPMDRVVAVTDEPDFTLDCYHKLICARPMPLYSVPGLMDHF